MFLAATAFIKLYAMYYLNQEFYLQIVSVCISYLSASCRACMDYLSDSGFTNAVCATAGGKLLPSKQPIINFLSLAVSTVITKQNYTAFVKVNMKKMINLRRAENE